MHLFLNEIIYSRISAKFKDAINPHKAAQEEESERGGMNRRL